MGHFNFLTLILESHAAEYQCKNQGEEGREDEAKNRHDNHSSDPQNLIEGVNLFGWLILFDW